MSFPKRDLIATVLVALACCLYGLWTLDAALPGLRSVRATGIVILVLGFAASGSAVVPGFEQLLKGNKIYVALTSIIGVVAFVAGLQMLIGTSETGLAVMIIAMVVLWAISTVHHSMLAKPSGAGPTLKPTPPRAAVR